MIDQSRITSSIRSGRREQPRLVYSRMTSTILHLQEGQYYHHDMKQFGLSHRVIPDHVLALCTTIGEKALTSFSLS